MEIEKSQQEIIAKKVWNMVRIVFYMTRKGITKTSKIMVDLQMLRKKGKIASKAIDNYYSTLTCRSHDDANMSFITPREYEFSCSNTPIFTSKRKSSTHYGYQSAQEVKAMQKVFDILNRYDTVEASPLFGPSPYNIVRVTDSPVSTTKEENNNIMQVDRDAEEFINKFYMDLKNQKRMAALESPSPYHNMWPGR